MQYIRRITIDDSEHIALTEAIEIYKKFAESKKRLFKNFGTKSERSTF